MLSKGISMGRKNASLLRGWEVSKEFLEKKRKKVCVMGVETTGGGERG